MSMNTFGTLYRVTTFGESHGAAIGGVIDGMPAGVKLDLESIQHQLDRRRPGQSAITTARSEADRVELLSGVMDGVTTGTPIGFIVRNSDQHSRDYDNMRHVFRPSHADYTYAGKYGVRDHRGGGRSSARETIARVVGGAVAMQALRALYPDMCISVYTSRVGDICMRGDGIWYAPSLIDSNDVRCPDRAAADAMRSLILDVKGAGDTIGGVVTAVVRGVPAGLGEPVAGKLHAMLGAAMLSINAAKGFEYGMGFDGCCRRGSEMIDVMESRGAGEAPRFISNHSGGIQGGISNGEDIVMRVAFKPVATLLREVATVDDSGADTTLHARGRHDPCVLPRAVPVVEAMAAMTLLDAALLNRSARII
ncbi:chorismate synthase [Muribaculaceae bacterium Isolate-007 (NCI)]|nr:chorismate synthase [Muribaculum intestinale]ROT07917.1 chorismate synthase [Muribaculaceae bacterium Isolate-100 (HZI)]RXE66481.1 chorismate synthase [Muribaculaceae bacterium Isolate-007 (NCI)]TGX87320.1 chorismate synthase [Muribaculum intestinale]